MRKDAKLVFKFLEKHGDELIERLYSMAKNNQKIDAFLTKQSVVLTPWILLIFKNARDNGRLLTQSHS